MERCSHNYLQKEPVPGPLNAIFALSIITDFVQNFFYVLNTRNKLLPLYRQKSKNLIKDVVEALWTLKSIGCFMLDAIYIYREGTVE